MSNWRPPDWKNPLEGKPNRTAQCGEGVLGVTYEIGADAMLEQLRKQGVKVDLKKGEDKLIAAIDQLALNPTQPKGTVIFIPDDSDDTPRTEPDVAGSG